MNNNRLGCLSLIVVNVFWCSAQYSLQKKYVHMRPQDTLFKQEVVAPSPGRKGKEVLWNFQNLTPIADRYRVCYGGSDSLPTLKEELTVYRYTLTDKNRLQINGYCNGTTNLNALYPEQSLRYPFHYNDSLISYFYGEGKYSEKLSFVSQGETIVTADGYGGILLPGSDTIKNVLRVCWQKEICEQMSGSDSIHWTVHRDSLRLHGEAIRRHLNGDSIRIRSMVYRWYAEGYRYPVFETLRFETLRKGEVVAYRERAFHYPPQEHLYLTSDLQNQRLQESIRQREHSTEKLPNDMAVISYYNLFPSPVKRELTIEYYTSGKTEVWIRLSNIEGILCFQKQIAISTEGIYDEQILMDAYPPGIYLLNLVVGPKSYAEKIVKID